MSLHRTDAISDAVPPANANANSSGLRDNPRPASAYTLAAASSPAVSGRVDSDSLGRAMRSPTNASGYIGAPNAAASLNAMRAAHWRLRAVAAAARR